MPTYAKLRRFIMNAFLSKFCNDPRKLRNEVNNLGQFTENKMRINVKTFSQHMSDDAAVTAMNEYFAHSM